MHQMCFWQGRSFIVGKFMSNSYTNVIRIVKCETLLKYLIIKIVPEGRDAGRTSIACFCLWPNNVLTRGEYFSSRE